MENMGNVNNYEDITSLDSSDESLYYSVSSSPVLPPYEEFDNYSYVSESDSSSNYSGIYQPVVGQVNPTVYPTPANYIEVLGIFPVEVRGTTYYQPQFYYIPVHSNIYAPYSPYLGEQEYETDSTEYCSTHSDTDYSSSNSDAYYTAEEYESYTELEEDDYEAEEFGYFNEANFETTSFEFSPSDDFELSKDEKYLAPESQKNNYEKEGCDNIKVQNELNYTSAENIKNNKTDKHRPFYIGDISERNNFSEKCSVNTFDFAGVNSKYSQNNSLEKYNSFDDLSGKKQGQPLKKHQSFENLSLFEDNEIHDKDCQYENTVIMMDNYDENKKSLSSDPYGFEEDLSEEEIKYAKDQIYLRALSGKLYQKTNIPSVAILPTIYEENECFAETDEELSDLETPCLNGNQALLNSSLCNVFEPADENLGLLTGSLSNLFEPSDEKEDIFEESQQKPKKKKMKRLREFLARIFCCVKPTEI